MMNDFETWWEEEGKEKSYPMDLTLAKELARLSWNASRVEQTKYVPLKKKPCDGCDGNCCKE